MHSTVAATIALVAAVGTSAGVLTPAARAEVQPLLRYLAVISCSSSTPCQEGNNASTGAGLEGISVKGSGVIGQTKFNGTVFNAQAGVLGQDGSASGHNPGVKGISTRGDGVDGFSGPPSGLFRAPAGVTGDSKNADGLHGLSANGSGLFADSINGIAVDTFSGRVGVNAVGGAITSSDQFPALSLVGNGSGAPLVAGCASRNPCDINFATFQIAPSGFILTKSAIAAVGGVSIFSGVSVDAGIPPIGSVNISGQ